MVRKMTSKDKAILHLIKFNSLEQIQKMPEHSFPAMERGFNLISMDWKDVRCQALMEKIKELK